MDMSLSNSLGSLLSGETCYWKEIMVIQLAPKGKERDNPVIVWLSAFYVLSGFLLAGNNGSLLLGSSVSWEILLADNFLHSSFSFHSSPNL